MQSSSTIEVTDTGDMHGSKLSKLSWVQFCNQWTKIWLKVSLWYICIYESKYKWYFAPFLPCEGFSYTLVLWENLWRVLINMKMCRTHPPCSWTHTLNFSTIYRWLQYVMKSNLSLRLLRKALIARSEQKKKRTTTRSDVTPPSCNKTIMTVAKATSCIPHISQQALFQIL